MTRCVAWLLAACAASQVPALDGAVLTGTVLSDDGTPVDRAIVTILGSDGPAVRVSATSAAGEFSVGGLPAGSFAVWAAKPGLVTTYYGSKRPGRGPAIPIALASGQRATVSLTMLRGASISGRVTDPSGRPLAQISMQVRPAFSPGAGASATLTATTDGQGGYRVFGLAPGDYIVAALPPSVPNPQAALVSADDVRWALQQAQQGSGRPLGSANRGVTTPDGPAVAYAPTFFPGVAVIDQAVQIALTSGEQREDVTFSLQLVRAARISGRVLATAGQLMSGTHLALVRSEPAAIPVRAVPGATANSLRLPVSDTGEFSAAGLVPGTYTLWARWDANILGPVGPDAHTLWGHAKFVVNGFDVSDVVLGLQPGARVSGMIRLDAASRRPTMDTFRVSLSPQFSDAAPFTSTLVTTPDGSGRFAFPSVPPGPYDLRTVASTTTNSTGATWVLESAIASGQDVADGTLDIRPGEEISGVVVTLTDQETEISGTLLDSAKRPTAQFSLLFFSVDRTSWTSRSRRVQTVQPAVDGTFKVKGLPPGEYFVVGDASIDLGTVLDAAYLEQLVAVASRVTIARGEKRRVDLAVTAR